MSLVEMQERERIQRRDEVLGRPTTVAGLPVEFDGHKYQVGMTDDCRKFMHSPHPIKEVAAA